MIAFFFFEGNMNCVNACHDPRNPNSGKIMKKCGMVYEGTILNVEDLGIIIVKASLYKLMKRNSFLDNPIHLQYYIFSNTKYIKSGGGSTE